MAKKYCGKYADAYRKQRKRINAAINRMEKSGYIFEDKNSILPPIPKKITKASVNRLSKITPSKLREKAVIYSSDKTEFVAGWRGPAIIRRNQQRQRELYGKDYKRILQEKKEKRDLDRALYPSIPYNDSFNDIQEPVLPDITPDIQTETEYYDEYEDEYVYAPDGGFITDPDSDILDAEKYVPQEKIDELPDAEKKAQQIRKHNRVKKLRYARVAPTQYSGIVLDAVRNEISSWGPPLNQGDTWAAIKEHDKSVAEHVLDGAIKEFGADVVAMRMDANAEEIYNLIDQILYGSDDNNKGGYTTSAAIVRFRNILYSDVLSQYDAQQLMAQFDSMDDGYEE